LSRLDHGRQIAAPCLLTPIPEQTAADDVSARHVQKVDTLQLGLGNNPQLVLNRPATTTLNPVDDLLSLGPLRHT
jgi:hypothetical protein